MSEVDFDGGERPAGSLRRSDTLRGFASVVYALLILEAGLARSDELRHLAALIIAAPILALSSTDVLVARWFELGPSPDTDPETQLYPSTQRSTPTIRPKSPASRPTQAD